MQGKKNIIVSVKGIWDEELSALLFLYCFKVWNPYALCG